MAWVWITAELKHQVFKRTSASKKSIQCFALLFQARILCMLCLLDVCPAFWIHTIHLDTLCFPKQGLCPAQKGLYKVCMRRRLLPLSWLHRSEKPQGNVGEEMQSTLSFQKHRTARITHQAPPKKPKKPLRVVSKSNEQFNIGYSEYCIGSTLESNLHLADPMYFSIHLPANTSYEKTLNSNL